MDLEEIWRIREEDIYPRIFGGSVRGIFPLTAELFIQRFGCKTYDPLWLSYGVMEYGPTALRPYWLYATSAYSNPWGVEPNDYDSAGPSGSGVEFLFATTEQGAWAISFLQNMLAFDMLLSLGHFGERPPLSIGDRVPLNSPINGQESCLIRHAILTQPDSLPRGFDLPSGHVDLLSFVGITDDELAYAKQNGSDQLSEYLHAKGCLPVTDPQRQSTL